MGLRFRGNAVLVNDAIVVLCFTAALFKQLTVHGFRLRAAELGFMLTKAQASSMLTRAMGRVKYTGPPSYLWELTAAGLEYRKHVRQIVATLAGSP